MLGLKFHFLLSHINWGANISFSSKLGNRFYSAACLIFVSSFFVVDDYVLVAKDKHGYNVEQVHAFCREKILLSVFTVTRKPLLHFRLMYTYAVDTVICLIEFHLLFLSDKSWIMLYPGKLQFCYKIYHFLSAWHFF